MIRFETVIRSSKYLSNTEACAGGLGYKNIFQKTDHSQTRSPAIGTSVLSNPTDTLILSPPLLDIDLFLQALLATPVNPNHASVARLGTFPDLHTISARRRLEESPTCVSRGLLAGLLRQCRRHTSLGGRRVPEQFRPDCRGADRADRECSGDQRGKEGEGNGGWTISTFMQGEQPRFGFVGTRPFVGSSIHRVIVAENDEPHLWRHLKPFLIDRTSWIGKWDPNYMRLLVTCGGFGAWILLHSQTRRRNWPRRTDSLRICEAN